MKAAAGFLLIEASIAYVILTLAIVALVPLYALSVRATTTAQTAVTASHLSEELLDEIRLRRWDSKSSATPSYIATGSATLGIDTGESATDKRTFDDIDDFNGWTESTLMDPTMQPVSGMTGFQRQATVSYVDSNDNVVAGPTDYKQVQVCTTYQNKMPICLVTLLTNH